MLAGDPGAQVGAGCGARPVPGPSLRSGVGVVCEGLEEIAQDSHAFGRNAVLHAAIPDPRVPNLPISTICPKYTKPGNPHHEGHAKWAVLRQTRQYTCTRREVSFWADSRKQRVWRRRPLLTGPGFIGRTLRAAYTERTGSMIRICLVRVPPRPTAWAIRTATRCALLPYRRFLASRRQASGTQQLPHTPNISPRIYLY
jgi:hypothetical protein